MLAVSVEEEFLKSLRVISECPHCEGCQRIAEHLLNLWALFPKEVSAEDRLGAVASKTYKFD